MKRKKKVIRKPKVLVKPARNKRFPQADTSQFRGTADNMLGITQNVGSKRGI